MPSNLSVHLDAEIDAFLHPNARLHATSNTNSPTLLCMYTTIPTTRLLYISLLCTTEMFKNMKPVITIHLMKILCCHLQIILVLMSKNIKKHSSKVLQEMKINLQL